MTRRYTNKLLEMVDDGVLDARDVLGVALKAMSEAEVESIAQDDYGIDLDEEDEEEDEEDEEEEEDEDYEEEEDEYEEAAKEAAATEAWLYGDDPFGAEAVQPEE